MSTKLDIHKFEDGYETAVKTLVDAKVNNLPVPIDEAPPSRPSNVVNLMDALRKSIGADKTSAKKPPKSVKAPPAKGIGIVKTPAKAARRKSA
jgi:DNA end-binding protein Ku